MKRKKERKKEKKEEKKGRTNVDFKEVALTLTLTSAAQTLQAH